MELTSFPSFQPKTEIKHDITFGLDLGQCGDFSALVGTERFEEHEKNDGVKAIPRDEWAELVRTAKATGNYSFSIPKPVIPPARHECKAIIRWDVNTPYPDMVSQVCRMFRMPQFSGASLVIDGTGVGRPVVDMFRKARPNCHIVPVTITGGQAPPHCDDAGYWCVNKREMVAVLNMLMQTRRIIAGSIPNSGLLLRELRSFQLKQKASTGNVSMECLVAGTLIETRDGLLPIEKVKKGQDVLTRFGYNRVAWSGETKRVTSACRVRFDNGQSLIGTPDHLVFTLNRGWVPLGELSCLDTCMLAPTTGRRVFSPRWSYSTELNIGDRRSILTTLHQGRVEVGQNCTELSGFITMGRSLKATTSTTLMKIGTITTSPIWRASATAITKNGTGRKTRQLRSDARLVVRVSSACPTEGLGMGCTASEMCTARGSASGIVPSRSMTFDVPTAENGLRAHASAVVLSSVLGSVGKPIATCTGVIRRESARGAEQTSKPSTKYPGFVRVAAPPKIVRSAELQPVYDLIVDGHHEFFANGILVHNSWREGEHDDIVLACALATWWAERARKEFWYR